MAVNPTRFSYFFIFLILATLFSMSRPVDAGIIPGYHQSEINAAMNSRPSSKGQDMARGQLGEHAESLDKLDKRRRSETGDPTLDFTLRLFGRHVKRVPVFEPSTRNVASYPYSRKPDYFYQALDNEGEKSKHGPSKFQHPARDFTLGIFGRRVKRSPAHPNVSYYYRPNNLFTRESRHVDPKQPFATPRQRTHSRDFFFSSISIVNKHGENLVVEPYPSLVVPRRHRHRSFGQHSQPTHKWLERREQAGVRGRVDITSPGDGPEKGERSDSLCLTEHFTLNACEKNQTVIYLVGFTSNKTTASDHISSAPENDQVMLQIPVYDSETLSMTSYCATFDPNPDGSKPLTVEPCSTSTADVEPPHKSQKFSFNRDTNILRPMQNSQSQLPLSSSLTTAIIRLNLRRESGQDQNLSLVFVPDAPVAAKHAFYSSTATIPETPDSPTSIFGPSVTAAHFATSIVEQTNAATIKAVESSVPPRSLSNLTETAAPLVIIKGDSAAFPSSRYEPSPTRSNPLATPTKWGADDNPLIVNVSAPKPTPPSTSKTPLDAELVASRIADRLAARAVPTFEVVDQRVFHTSL